MKHGIVSASSTATWVNCQLSARLPQEHYDVGPAAKVGTRFHALIAACIDASEWVPLDPMDAAFEPSLRAALTWLDTELSHPCDVYAEQAFEVAPLGAYEREEGVREPKWRELFTAKVLKGVSNRNYPGEYARIYGTADVVIVDKDSVHVIDWKTGSKRPEYVDQLRTLGVAAAEVYGRNTVKVTAAYVNIDKATVKTVTDILDGLDIHTHAGAMASAMRAIVGKPLPDPVEGKHCWNCHAVGCPAKLRNAR